MKESGNKGEEAGMAEDNGNIGEQVEMMSEWQE